MFKSLESLISGKGMNLNPRNNPTLDCCVSPGNLPELTSPLSQHLLCLSLKKVFKVVAWVIWGSHLVFLGISLVYKK